MKPYFLILELVLGLTLAGCHRGLYSATAEIQVRIRTLADISGPVRNDPPAPNPKQYADREIELLQKDDVFLPVIQKLNLSEVWSQRFKSDHAVWTDKETLHHLHKVLEFEAQPGTTIIKITASSEVPQEAADIANAIADNDKGLRDRWENQRTQRERDSLRQQIDDQQKVVDLAKTQREEWMKKYSGTTPDSRNIEWDEEKDLVSAKKKLLAAQEDFDSQDVVLKKIRDLSDTDTFTALQAMGRLPAGTTPDKIPALRQEIAANVARAKIFVDTSQQQVAQADRAYSTNAAAKIQLIRDVERYLQQQRSLLEVLKTHLRLVAANSKVTESPVRILTRAIAPPE